MKRRRLLLVGLALLLLLSGLLLVRSMRWPIYGWLRGEAFYQGRLFSKSPISLVPAAPADFAHLIGHPNGQLFETLGGASSFGL